MDGAHAIVDPRGFSRNRELSSLAFPLKYVTVSNNPWYAAAVFAWRGEIVPDSEKSVFRLNAREKGTGQQPESYNSLGYHFVREPETIKAFAAVTGVLERAHTQRSTKGRVPDAALQATSGLIRMTEMFTGLAPYGPNRDFFEDIVKNAREATEVFKQVEKTFDSKNTYLNEMGPLTSAARNPTVPTDVRWEMYDLLAKCWEPFPVLVAEHVNYPTQRTPERFIVRALLGNVSLSQAANLVLHLSSEEGVRATFAHWQPLLNLPIATAYAQLGCLPEDVAFALLEHPEPEVIQALAANSTVPKRLRVLATAAYQSSSTNFPSNV